MKVAVLGGGAAGFFSALSCKAHHPGSDVTIYEKSGKLLSKVKVSGGGRCNVTNACFSISRLAKNYPRGKKQLKKAFSVFSTADTVEWFESRGVKLKAEPDNRMFPVTDNSQTIIDCLMNETQKAGIKIRTNCLIHSIQKTENGFTLSAENEKEIHSDKIIVATGGSPKPEGFEWLAKLGHSIQPPVPSLFTFNIPDNALTELMGVSVEDALVKIQGTKLKQSGPLLITHWGMSGPAVLKLSSWGARVLNEMNYDFKINVTWNGTMQEHEVRELIAKEYDDIKRKKISNVKLLALPSGLWLYLLTRCDINPETNWADLSKEKLNRLINALCNDEYHVKGKTTFREEFVTCGGVSLGDVNFATMESNVCRGMYFTGEVLDIDGVTGGFNFQSAWTTGFIAGKLSSAI
ncbi:MAG: NAD(P)/FAD-dependent oxidoreductase [Bacteroidia bacterium]|nr:NAD(P)/FAD-dependent oxidoreductase [Bacteroidia bacterium]